MNSTSRLNPKVLIEVAKVVCGTEHLDKDTTASVTVAAMAIRFGLDDAAYLSELVAEVQALHGNLLDVLLDVLATVEADLHTELTVEVRQALTELRWDGLVTYNPTDDTWQASAGRAQHNHAEISAVLRAAGEACPSPLTSPAYMAWRSSFGGWSPSTRSLTLRYGSWVEACAAAGVTANPTAKNKVRWSAEAIVEALRRYVASSGRPLTVGAYEPWSKGRRDVPSVATIRARFGTWAAARSAASDQMMRSTLP